MSVTSLTPVVLLGSGRRLAPAGDLGQVRVVQAGGGEAPDLGGVRPDVVEGGQERGQLVVGGDDRGVVAGGLVEELLDGRVLADVLVRRDDRQEVRAVGRLGVGLGGLDRGQQGAGVGDHGDLAVGVERQEGRGDLLDQRAVVAAFGDEDRDAHVAGVLELLHLSVPFSGFALERKRMLSRL